MKKFYTLFTLLLMVLGSNVHAQYSVGACTDYSLNSCGTGSMLISNGTFAISGDDQISGAIAMPFNFTFYGTSYSSVYVSSNGFITFNGGGSACCSGYSLPNTNSTAYIAMAHTDLYAYSGTPGTNGSVYYSTVGTSPNQIFVVHYQNLDQCCGTNSLVTGEIQLFE